MITHGLNNLRLASSESGVNRFPFGFTLKLIGDGFGAPFDKRLDRDHISPALKAGPRYDRELLPRSRFFEL